MSAALRVVVADDEPLARESITSLLERDEEVQLSGSCADGVSAVSAVGASRPDILFLDIQMPGMNGFEVLEELLATTSPHELPVVVMVTAYDQHALRAFEYHAVDYLLKPFTDERFFAALEHAKQLVRTREDAEVKDKLKALLAQLRFESPAAATSLERFVVKIDGAATFLEYPEIIWFEAANHYVLIHTVGKQLLCRDAMSSLERRLPQERFFRLHRSAIVNLEHVRELRTEGREDTYVVLKNKQRLAISRRRLPELRKQLGLG